MATDNELLRKYTQAGSEAAFKELVQRHVNMVYATALRETDANPHLAEDLAQSVFVELARKAKSLEQHPALAGWLYTCVRLTAANARRAEDRRQRRQQEYQTMAELHSSESPIKCYLITTATVFGVLAGFHVWRASIEGMRLIREPLFLGLTLAAISLCCWGCSFLVRYSRSR